jgi:hypothetical protein
MICREFSLLYSAQVDGHADEREQMALQRHLRKCGGCRRRAAELRSLRSELRVLEAPQAKGNLTVQLQAALRVEARAHERVERSRTDLIEVWRTRLFSQGVGALVSMGMFIMTLAGVMQPAYRTLALAKAATQVILEEDEIDPDIRLRVLLLQPPPPPVLAPSGELLNLGAGLSEGDEIIATVKVRKDGRASINEIYGAPRDPAMVTKFSSVMTQQASFQPTRRAQATSAEAVVILSKVDIKANISG